RDEARLFTCTRRQKGFLSRRSMRRKSSRFIVNEGTQQRQESKAEPKDRSGLGRKFFPTSSCGACACSPTIHAAWPDLRVLDWKSWNRFQSSWARQPKNINLAVELQFGHPAERIARNRNWIRKSPVPDRQPVSW